MENLIDIIKTSKKNEDGATQFKGLGENLTKIYMAQLVNALEYLQQQEVIHRDLKPLNIMFDKKCNVKLIDFGDAKVMGDLDIEEIQEDEDDVGYASASRGLDTFVENDQDTEIPFQESSNL